MLETIYQLTQTPAKLIEKVVDDQHVAINHMILPAGDALPEHSTNSHVYMIVTKGEITLSLSDQPAHVYQSGTIINIPFDLKMNAINQRDQTTELVVVKSPHPRDMIKT